MSTRVRVGVAGLAVVLIGGLMTAHAYRQPEEKPKKATEITGRLTPTMAAAEEAAIRKMIDAFSTAYNKQDLDGVMAVWTEDAEFVADTGKAYRGKETIRILLKRSLANNKDSKQSVRVQSLRFFRPDVALETGVVTLTQKDGSSEDGKYEAVWMKIDGKWLINRVRDLADAPEGEEPPAVSQLKPLAWLAGEWTDKDAKGDVTLSCKWGPGQTYLVMEFHVKREDGKHLTISQRVGYDAANESVRSWVFDSGGGFGGGYWTRDGNTWTVASGGTYPDGRASSSEDTWKFTNDGEFTYSSKNREVEDAPLPDLTVTFVKKKAS
jgi:uncharacterized protein (TIGR02246 family)